MSRRRQTPRPGPPLDRRGDFDDELLFHVERATEDLVADGWTEEEARAEVLRRFGDVEETRRHSARMDRKLERAERRRTMTTGIGQDFAYALRQVARRPSVAALVVLTLGMGIGSVTSIFALIDGILLRPLPYHEPDRLVRIWDVRTRDDRVTLANPNPWNFRDWQAGLRSFDNLVGTTGSTMTLTDAQGAERVRGAWLTADFFGTLGVPLALGREPTEAEDAQGEPAPVVVISHGAWTRRYGNDPAVLGRTVVLDGTAFEIIGVAPEGFVYPAATSGDAPEFYRPGGFGEPNGRGGHWMPVFARLGPGTTMEAAQREISALAAELAELYPRSNTGLDARLQPLSESVVGESRAVLGLLMAAVALLLVIACANVAGLLLVRTMGRSAEFGVRAALGAGRGRIVRQLVVESMVLGAAGALTGIVLAWGLLSLSSQVAVLGLPRLDGVRVDGGVLAFATLVGIATSVLSGALPSVAIFRRAAATPLRSGAASAGPGRGRLHRTLVAGEVALSVVLLTLALLLSRSYGRLAAVDPGFRSEGVAVARLVLPEGTEAATVEAFYAEVLGRARALPGVTAVGGGDSPPFQSAQNSSSSYWPDDRPAPEDETPHPMAFEQYVTSGYFEAMGIPLLAGRAIEATDGRDAIPVAVVSQAFVDQTWPGRSAVGERFSYNGTHWEVVGVVGSVRRGDLTAPPSPEMFFPQFQHPWVVPTDLFLAVRGSGDPALRVPEIRRIVREANPDVPVELATTMSSMVSAALAPERVRSLVLVVFALMAMVLAGLGVYGIMAYSVAARRRELAVRRSLGAPSNELLSMVVRRALAVVAVGVGVGLAGAVAAGGLVERFLFGVASTDPSTLAFVAVATLGLGVAASALPARRAAEIDPVRELREQDGP